MTIDKSSLNFIGQVIPNLRRSQSLNCAKNLKILSIWSIFVKYWSFMPNSEPTMMIATSQVLSWWLFSPGMWWYFVMWHKSFVVWPFFPYACRVSLVGDSRFFLGLVMVGNGFGSQKRLPFWDRKPYSPMWCCFDVASMMILGYFWVTFLGGGWVSHRVDTFPFPDSNMPNISLNLWCREVLWKVLQKCRYGYHLVCFTVAPI